jgi:hypothetical protein
VISSLVAIALIPLGPVCRLGRADITPPEALPLGGYTARGGKPCELPGDRLEARAAVFSDRGPTGNRAKIAFVSADLLTIPASLREEVQKRIPRDVQLFLVATHTHCAPDSQMLNRQMTLALPGIAKFQEKWLLWYAARIADAVRFALDAKSAPAGEWTLALGNRALNRARRSQATADPLAARLLTPSGEPILTQFAAHAVLYGPAENHPRTDFPGLIRGPQGLFLPGAIGDMSPASKGATPKEQVRYFAQQFESGPWEAAPLNLEPMRVVRIPLGELSVSAHPDFARLNKIPAPLASSIVQQFAPKSGDLTVVRMGKLAIVGVPGEPTAELGRKIRSIGLGLGFRAVLTVSHVNGWMGYILAPDDYERGGYEASLAFHGKDFGALIVQRAREGLQAIRDSGHSKPSKPSKPLEAAAR